MKVKRILNTLVIVLSIVFLMNGVSMALEQAPIRIFNPVFSCSMSVALAGFCIESMNPTQGAVFSMSGGNGTITVYYPQLTTISATSSNPSAVTITGFKVLDANHLLISYKVAPTESINGDVYYGNGYFCDKIGTITIKAKGSRSVSIYQGFLPPP